MYRYLLYPLIVMVLSSTLQAASIRSQVSLLEASENIRLGSQQIVVTYLSYYLNPKKRYRRDLALKKLKELEKQFELIDRSMKDEESRDVLNFLYYSREKMLKLIQEPIEGGNPHKILEYSEILLKAADSITRELGYTLSEDEKMLIKMKDISFLMEKMTKSYLLLQTDKNSASYMSMVKSTIAEMDKALILLDDYNYSAKSLLILSKLHKNWKGIKPYYLKESDIEIENILLLASKQIEKNSLLLEKYHSKNQ
ncbi:MAG: hypothetical protein U9R27_04225 [Campylobacterota bacterium]|nr:hypothetical protein [Campylobacterota bacterium]